MTLDEIKQQISHLVQYFNPESNNGHNFWSGQTAQNLSNIQRKVVQPVQDTYKQAVTNWNMPKEERAKNYRRILAKELEKTPSTPKWVNSIQDYTESLPAKAEAQWQKTYGNAPAYVKPLLEPAHIGNKLVSGIPNLLTGMAIKSKEEQKRIEDIKRSGTEEQKANLQKELMLDDASSIAFGATSNPVLGGLNPQRARAILKVSPNATEAEILSAYKRLIVKEAPRSNIDAKNLSKSNAFRLINDAKKLLLDQITSTEPKLLEGGVALTNQTTGLPLRSNEPPVIDRTKLTGRQLGLTNEQLLNPEKIARSEDLGVANKDYLRNKPIKEQTTIEKTHNFVEDMKQEIRNPNGVFNNVSVKTKVNWLDYVRTPDRVLKKMGLEKEAKALRNSWEKYQTELPVEIQKVTDWSKRVTRPEGNKLIFKYLDGQINKNALESNELAVATEIKDYLKGWATKLKIPDEKRISSYISHIFENEVSGLEFPDEIASLIRDNVAGSVYDPFLIKRRNKQGYIEDTWRALDAYVKRATRKYNMDDILSQVKYKSETFEDSQFKYIKSYIDRVNMRPTEIDTLIDNWIKTTPVGYKLSGRPTANITRKLRRMVYRGLLGLNPSSAIRNLSQSSNTYAELGEKYFLTGTYKTLRELPKFILNKNTELEKVGVLQSGFIDDRVISATKKNIEAMDEGLFYMFNLAEKINRSISYYGAKSKALNEGKSYKEAVEYAKEITRKTQFAFSSIDTPQILQSDLAKTMFQFQSYGVKQVEFLAEKVSKKEWAGIIRYIASMMLFISTVGKMFGMKIKDIIPSFRFGVPPTLQVAQGISEVATGQNDKWGNEPSENLVKRTLENYNIQKGVTAYIPAGNQIFNKTIPALNEYSKGESTTPSGGMRYTVEKNPSNLVKGVLFGPKNTDEAQAYYSNEVRPLSKKQADIVRGSNDKQKTYQSFLSQRDIDNQISDDKEAVKATGQPKLNNNYYTYLDDGDVKTINLAFTPTKPELTGNANLDKKLISKYKSELTKKENIIVVSYEQGLINKEEAEKELLAVQALRSGLKSGVGSKKKVSYKKITPVKVTNISPKKIGNLKQLKTAFAFKTKKPNLKLKQTKKIYG